MLPLPFGLLDEPPHRRLLVRFHPPLKGPLHNQRRPMDYCSCMNDRPLCPLHRRTANSILSPLCPPLPRRLTRTLPATSVLLPTYLAPYYLHASCISIVHHYRQIIFCSFQRGVSNYRALPRGVIPPWGPSRREGNQATRRAFSLAEYWAFPCSSSRTRKRRRCRLAWTCLATGRHKSQHLLFRYARSIRLAIEIARARLRWEKLSLALW